MEQLERLLNRLKEAQRALLLAAAETDMLPSEKSLSKIADLEVAIAATEALIDEQPAKKSAARR